MVGVQRCINCRGMGGGKRKEEFHVMVLLGYGLGWLSSPALGFGKKKFRETCLDHRQQFSQHIIFNTKQKVHPEGL